MIKDYIELTKPRICVLALVMVLFGYGMAIEPGDAIWTWRLMWSLIGVGAVGASCGVLNQYIERDLDAQMARTKNRPLATGRINPKHGLIFGVVLGVIGEIVLLAFINELTAALAALTLFLYIAIYTPSKRVSTLSTIIGAFPGAMPPLLGWTSVTGVLGYEGLVLFTILFVWQIPHFLAIGWMYRHDYSQANFPILTVVDTRGNATAKQIVIYSLTLIPVTMLAGLTGIAGRIYCGGAALLGVWFLVQGFKLAVNKTDLQARKLFFVSIVYLPLLGFLMVWDRL